MDRLWVQGRWFCCEVEHCHEASRKSFYGLDTWCACGSNIKLRLSLSNNVSKCRLRFRNKRILKTKHHVNRWAVPGILLNRQIGSFSFLFFMVECTMLLRYTTLPQQWQQPLNDFKYITVSWPEKLKVSLKFGIGWIHFQFQSYS